MQFACSLKSKELISKRNRYDISVFKIVPSNNSLVISRGGESHFFWQQSRVEKDPGLIDEEGV